MSTGLSRKIQDDRFWLVEVTLTDGREVGDFHGVRILWEALYSNTYNGRVVTPSLGTRFQSTVYEFRGLVRS